MATLAPTSVNLESGDSTLEVAPAAGGAIVRWSTDTDRGRLDWLRPAAPADIAAREPTGLSCFPLVPFSNRVRDGRFPFGGRDVQLPANFPPEPHAIHGHGWKAAWDVVEWGADRLVLAYEHDADAWPFPYRATQTFALAPRGLRVEIAVENRGGEPMPAGIGLHPYFVRTPGARLTAGVEGVWLSEGGIPTELVPVPPAWDLARGLDPGAVSLDNNFAGWDGRARVDWPERETSLTLTADGPFGFLVVYTPPGEPFLCAEPVTNVVDAFNLAAAGREDTGTVVLAPGEQLAGTVSFELG